MTLTSSALFSMLPAVATARNVTPDMQVYLWEWFALGAIILGMILFDLFGHVRKPHEPTIKEAAIWSAIYVAIALLFGVLMYFRHSGQFAEEYFTGYITEKALSLDNIFVFIIVIAAFKVPRIFQQKVLMYGIIIAIVLRFFFILLGAAIIEKFVWAFFIFGAWMVWTAYSQIKDGVEEDRVRRKPELAHDEEYNPTLVTRFVSKYANVTDDYVEDKLVVKRDGQRWITPLMLCIISIGTVDLLFALDSIPAIFGITKEPFIVFSANAFALLGLRQLFFLVDGLLERLIYLHFGLAIILGFIGYKLLIHAFHGYNILTNIPEPSTRFSVVFILGTIIITVIASIIGAKYYESKGIDVTNKAARMLADDHHADMVFGDRDDYDNDVRHEQADPTAPYRRQDNQSGTPHTDLRGEVEGRRGIQEPGETTDEG